MSFITSHLKQLKQSRRTFLIGAAAGLTAGTVPGFLPTPARAAGDGPTMAWSYRNRSNPYWNAIASGGEAFVESLGMSRDDLVHLINEGSSEKSLADVVALLAKTSGNLALAIDANDGPNGRPVVESVAETGGFVCTIWNKTDDLHPWDFGDNYVAHASWSSVDPAAQAARVVFDAMGGKGRVVGLGGIASNPPAIERRQGMMDALEDYPDIELLDYQPANWDTQKAAEVMASFLTRFGEIDGVICASDTMAFGALEALRAEGLVGRTKVGGYDGTKQAVDLVLKGEMSTTVDTNPYWAGGALLSLAWHAATGAFKPSDEPRAHREFFGPSILITEADAAEFKATYIDATPTYDWTDFWGPTTPAN
ncbi:MAG: sugar ABC transporter substrate-binding protein [Pseudomonadota bacterium]